MNKWFFLPFIFFLMVMGLFAIQLEENKNGNDPTLLESVFIGKSMPNFRINDLFEPRKEYTQSVFIGKTTLLNVWATWCPTCQKEHQFLDKLASDGIRIIGLNYKDDRHKAINWLYQQGDPYVMNFFDDDGMMGLDLGVYGAPETFIVDEHGIIQYRLVGEVNRHNWQKELQPIFNKLMEQSHKDE